MIPMMIGAGLSLAGSLYGGAQANKAQNQANALNWAIAQQNMRQQQQQNYQAQSNAEQARNDAKLGGTDGYGNSTKFIEGEGWKTTLSPEVQALYDYFRTQELPTRQSQFKRKDESSRTAHDEAQQLVAELQRVQKQDPQALQQLLYAQASRGIGEGTRDASSVAMREAARTGTTNAASILGALGKQGMDARANARVDSALKARGTVDAEYNNNRAGIGQLYQLFAQRGNDDIGLSYDPNAMIQGTGQAAGQYNGALAQGNALVNSSYRGPAAQLNYQQQPNLNNANAWASGGAALGSMFDMYQGYNDRQDSMNTMKNYTNGMNGLAAALSGRQQNSGSMF